LKKSGFKEELQYIPPTNANQDTANKKKRKRKIIWFNPPYSKNVKTNVGGTFLKLVAHHFPKKHPMHKIFNKNTVKMSYSCMRNTASIISSHNHNIFNLKPTIFGCNCKVKNDCPLNGECLTPNIIYRADVVNETTDEKKFYYGTSETTFKERYRNHCRDAKNAKHKKCTELAKYI